MSSLLTCRVGRCWLGKDLAVFFLLPKPQLAGVCMCVGGGGGAGAFPLKKKIF